MSSVMKRKIDGVVSKAVEKTELALTEIVSGQPMSELLAFLKAPDNVQVVDISTPSSGGPFIPARPLHAQNPLLQLAGRLSLQIWVRFYDIGGVPVYFVEEPPVTDLVKKIYLYLKNLAAEGALTRNASSREAIATSFLQGVSEIFENQGIDPSLAFAEPDVKAGIYYAWRDLFNYGPLEIPMEDTKVEEVSWYGYDYPVMVVDKDVPDYYPNAEFVMTNIFIPLEKTDNERKRIMEQVVKLVTSKARTGLTVARPIAEARIPDPSGRGFHRLAAHLDVVSRSPGLTIRKFPMVTYSLTSLIKYGELNELMAAYLIYHLLRRGFILIVGGMASGKTTLLQALISAMPKSYKVVTVEDTPELSTPAQNWHPLYVRPAPRESELDNVDFDRLIRHSLRHRGTIVTLGEVRGAEMASLIQAAASGHGAICTFHAHDPFSVLARIMSPPINAAPESLKLITAVVHVAFTKSYASGKPEPVRRILDIFEIEDVQGKAVKSATTFSWDPMTDQHHPRLFEKDGSPSDIPSALAEIWVKSPWIRTFGLNLYGEREPQRALTDVLALALFFHDQVRKGVLDTSQLLNNITSFYLELDDVANELWQKLREPLLAAIREAER